MIIIENKINKKLSAFIVFTYNKNLEFKKNIIYTYRYLYINIYIYIYIYIFFLF